MVLGFFWTVAMLRGFRSQQGRRASQLDQLLLWPPKMSFSVNIERLVSSSNVVSGFPIS